jgi:hypothetical protein
MAIQVPGRHPISLASYWLQRDNGQRGRDTTYPAYGFRRGELELRRRSQVVHRQWRIGNIACLIGVCRYESHTCASFVICFRIFPTVGVLQTPKRSAGA